MLGGTGVSRECPEMQSKPVSSCSHSTSTITPLGFSADSVPGMPTNLATKGTCIFVQEESKRLKINRYTVFHIKSKPCHKDLRNQKIAIENYYKCIIGQIFQIS